MQHRPRLLHSESPPRRSVEYAFAQELLSNYDGASPEPVRRQIDALLDEYTDAQVACILNDQQMRTGAGDSFDTVSIKWVRYSAKIKSLKERLRNAGWLTVKFEIPCSVGALAISFFRRLGTSPRPLNGE